MTCPSSPTPTWRSTSAPASGHRSSRPPLCGARDHQDHPELRGPKASPTRSRRPNPRSPPASTAGPCPNGIDAALRPRSLHRRGQLQRRLLHPLLRAPLAPRHRPGDHLLLAQSCPRESPANSPGSRSARRPRSRRRESTTASTRSPTPPVPASQVGSTKTSYGVGDALTYARGADLPGRPLPRPAALAGDDQRGYGRPVRPRNDRDPLCLLGQSADRPAADRGRLLGPDPPHPRRDTAAPAGRPHLHGPPRVHPQPDQLRTLRDDLDGHRLGRDLRRAWRRLERHRQPNISSCSTASSSASDRSSACGCGVRPRATATRPCERCSRPVRGRLDEAHHRRHAQGRSSWPRTTSARSAPGCSSRPENCPPDSVYGKAVVHSSLFDEPLRGPVYLRSSSTTSPTWSPRCGAAR